MWRFTTRSWRPIPTVHDAETLLITPKGEMLIVTKGDTGPVALYRFPPNARPNSMATLVRVGTARPSHKADGKGRITDGAISPNGEWAVLRTNRDLIAYRTADLLAGQWREAGGSISRCCANRRARA